MWTQRVTSLASALPRARKEAAREVPAKGQVGYPPGVTADAQLGYSVMAYQNAAILFGLCEGDSSILVRLAGTCATAHPRGRAELTRRANVEDCPCCTRSTHIAVPTRYSVGEFPKEKARGVSLST